MDSEHRIQTTITMTAMKTKHIVSNVVNISDPDIGFLCRAAPLRGPCFCSFLLFSTVFDHCCFCSGSFLKPVCFGHLICNHNISLLLFVSSFISLLFFRIPIIRYILIICHHFVSAVLYPLIILSITYRLCDTLIRTQIPLIYHLTGTLIF